jgi:hypothetical protein
MPTTQPPAASATLDESVALLGLGLDSVAGYENARQNIIKVLRQFSLYYGIHFDTEDIERFADTILTNVEMYLSGQPETAATQDVGKDEVRRTLAYFKQLSLQEPRKSSKDKSSMEVDTGYIQRVEAALEQPAATATPEHPVTDVRGKIAALAVEAAQLDDKAAQVQELGLSPAAQAELAVSGLAALARHSTEATWEAGLLAISNKLMSMVDLAKTFNVSTTTVWRRWHERYPDVPPPMLKRKAQPSDQQ